MTFALAHWKQLAMALWLALAFAGGYAARGKPPAPAVHAVEDTASTRAVAERKAVVDTKGPEKITTTVEEYGAPQEEAAQAPAGGMPDVQAVEGRAGQERQGAEGQAQAGTARAQEAPAGRLTRRTVTVTERGPEVITEHSTEQTHETAQAHLDLTVTPPPDKQGWAVGVGASLDSKQLRVELDRRLFGNLWIGASVVPARQELGLGLRMEF